LIISKTLDRYKNKIKIKKLKKVKKLKIYKKYKKICKTKVKQKWSHYPATFSS